MRPNKFPLAPVQGIVMRDVHSGHGGGDSEIIKEKLEALDAKLNLILAHLEGVRAAAASGDRIWTINERS